ncbi:MAG: hypothetical protein C5B45_03360 [Chlamydiae bacterium]|nr:MAG: hypothetical protein C5B45_03360 [Chlamydiota bacterium]
MQNEVVIDSDATVNIVVPERSLLVGSLQVIGKPDQTIDPSEIYEKTQKIIQMWQKQGITDYLRYRKVSDPSEYNMQIVPFSKNSWSFWQQLKVLNSYFRRCVYFTKS